MQKSESRTRTRDFNLLLVEGQCSYKVELYLLRDVLLLGMTTVPLFTPQLRENRNVMADSERPYI